MNSDFIMEYGLIIDQMTLQFNTFLNIKNKECEKQNLPYSKLSMKETRIMVYFTNVDTYKMGDIAKLTGISEKAINMYLKNLINLGYISKFQDKNDKRIFHTTITEKGKNIMNEYRNYANEIMTKVINDSLSDEEQNDMKNITAKLSNYFKKCNDNYYKV